MTEPQIWTALGILAAAFASTITIMTQMTTRLITGQFTSLRNELGTAIGSVRTDLSAKIEGTHAMIEATHARIDGTHTEINVLRTEMVLRFEQVDRRFERLEKQVDGLDRDMQAISKKVFPE